MFVILVIFGHPMTGARSSKLYNMEDLLCNGEGFLLVLNPDHTRPGRTESRTSHSIVKVSCCFGYRLYTSKAYNTRGLVDACERADGWMEVRKTW